MAARNCRKRKIDQIKQLETDVQRIRCRKTELITEHEKLVAQRNHWADLVKRLHDHVLKVNILNQSHLVFEYLTNLDCYSQELGHDPLHWMLQMDHNRQVHILPRTHTESDMDVAGAQAKVWYSLVAFSPVQQN